MENVVVVVVGVVVVVVVVGGGAGGSGGGGDVVVSTVGNFGVDVVFDRSPCTVYNRKRNHKHDKK